MSIDPEPCMTSDKNLAAWLSAKNRSLAVGDAPMPEPGAREIVVRNRAVALNPFDGIVQTLGGLVTPWLAYPAVLGSDVAGEVVAVGTAVTRFERGDRVLGLALGVDKIANRAAEGAFQRYVVLREDAVTALPDAMSFEQAAVLPLALATAACGLFLDDQLGLRPPAAVDRPRVGATVVVWGGSTSVGRCAIQLAAAAGYDVVTTASPRHAEALRALGAREVFDRTDPRVVATLVQRLKEVEVAGAIALGVGSGRPCIDVVSRCRGRRFVAMASAPVSLDDAPLTGQFAWMLARLPRVGLGFLGLAIRARIRGVRCSSIWGTALAPLPLCRTVFADFLEPALAQGRFVPSPAPLVAGHSLGDLPQAMARLRQGVSGQKIVVTL